MPFATRTYSCPAPDLSRFATTNLQRTMGLTIHYQLQLPRETPGTRVAELVAQLHSAAKRLPFETVGSLERTTTDPSADNNFTTPLGGFFMMCASLLLGAEDESGAWDQEAVPDAFGFAVMPGDGSEAAAFGVAWLAPRDDELQPLPNKPASWYWLAHCKTQYASNVSDAHFVHCHTTIVALLDEAVRLGFDVEVSDEGGYWESRDTSQLVAHVTQSSRLIAGLAGALHDKLGDDRLQAPIFRHPNFEHLEMGE